MEWMTKIYDMSELELKQMVMGILSWQLTKAFSLRDGKWLPCGLRMVVLRLASGPKDYKDEQKISIPLGNNF